MSIESSGEPSGASRPVTTPTGLTDGTSVRSRSRSSRYSRSAYDSTISLKAYTCVLMRTKRTTWREMPRGRATRYHDGHSSRGMSHGRSMRSVCSLGLAWMVSSTGNLRVLRTPTAPSLCARPAPSCV